MKPLARYAALAVLLGVSAVTVGWAANVHFTDEKAAYEGGRSTPVEPGHGFQASSGGQARLEAFAIPAPAGVGMFAGIAAPALPEPVPYASPAIPEPVAGAGCDASRAGGAPCFDIDPPTRGIGTVAGPSFHAAAGYSSAAFSRSAAPAPQGPFGQGNGLGFQSMAFETTPATTEEPGRTDPATPVSPETPPATPAPPAPLLPTAPVSPVPEPGTWAMLAAGLAAIAVLARRRATRP